ncbi:hypothetical protein Tco_0347869 [Tanacetum coccineum]
MQQDPTITEVLATLRGQENFGETRLGHMGGDVERLGPTSFDLCFIDRSDSELRPGYNGKFLEYGDHGMSDDQRMMNGIGSLGPVFLLGLSAFAMAAACASRAVVKSAISCRRASKVMAGVSDVDVLLGGILFNIDKTRSKIVISQVLKALRSCGMIHGAGCNDQNVEMMMERANELETN